MVSRFHIILFLLNHITTSTSSCTHHASGYCVTTYTLAGLPYCNTYLTGNGSPDATEGCCLSSEHDYPDYPNNNDNNLCEFACSEFRSNAAYECEGKYDQHICVCRLRAPPSYPPPSPSFPYSSNSGNCPYPTICDDGFWKYYEFQFDSPHTIQKIDYTLNTQDQDILVFVHAASSCNDLPEWISSERHMSHPLHSISMYRTCEKNGNSYYCLNTNNNPGNNGEGKSPFEFVFPSFS